MIITLNAYAASVVRAHRDCRGDTVTLSATDIRFGSQIAGMPRCEQCQPPVERIFPILGHAFKLGIAQASPMKCSGACSGRFAFFPRVSRRAVEQ